jgi:hypothetical protein
VVQGLVSKGMSLSDAKRKAMEFYAAVVELLEPVTTSATTTAANGTASGMTIVVTDSLAVTTAPNESIISSAHQ